MPAQMVMFRPAPTIAIGTSESLERAFEAQRIE
jgi:hypothetical protein